MLKGLNGQLIPWINDAEKYTSNVLEKPQDFSHAQEIEKKCATFAKVRGLCCVIWCKVCVHRRRCGLPTRPCSGWRSSPSCWTPTGPRPSSRYRSRWHVGGALDTCAHVETRAQHQDLNHMQLFRNCGSRKLRRLPRLEWNTWGIYWSGHILF